MSELVNLLICELVCLSMVYKGVKLLPSACQLAGLSILSAGTLVKVGGSGSDIG